MVIPLLLTSCSSGTSALTHDEYVRQANAICADLKHLPDVPEDSPVSEYPAQMRQTIDSMKASEKKLRALRAPTADRKALEEQFLNVGDQQIAALEAGLPALDEAAATGDRAAAEAAITPAVEEFARIGVAGDPFAKSYGLTECLAEG